MMKTGFWELTALLPRAAVMATMMMLPLMVLHGVHTGDESTIGRTTGGAGLVLLVSLKRAQ